MNSKLINILIVEDDYSATQTLQNHLEKLGYKRLMTARNSQQALKYFSECAIQLVFLDIGLIDSELDGIELGKRINTISGTTNIVFLTAFTDKSTIARSKEVVSLKYLAKEISERDIAVVMTELSIQQTSFNNNAKVEVETIEYREKDLLIKGKDKKQILIKGCDILYVAAGHGGITIHTARKEKIFTSTTLASFMRQYYNPDIIQIHRSHMINKRRMISKYEGKVTLENGMYLDIGELWRKSINDHFNVVKTKG